MSNVASDWNSAEFRRQRNAREALERLLDSRAGQHHGRAADLLRQAAVQDDRIARRCGRLADERARLQRAAGWMAVTGALVAVALIMFVSMARLPVVEQAILILAAGLSVAMFRLVVQPGRPVLGTQMLLQLLLTLFLVLGVGAEPFGPAVALLGWAAAFGRGWVEARARRIDIAEMELAMKVQGADARRAQMQMRRAAAI
ncbi:hypothetical protein [Sandaracinobacter sp.]|uniref:hypothetical protein n=1 Tax=Sandaracinobacter sp. TaxID=2487581 RepID=UPI0035B2C38C